MQEKFKKALYADAKDIGLIILSLGLGEEKSQRGFFAHDVTGLEVVKRIVSTHDAARMTHFAAKEYLRGYQALLDNTDLKACAYHPEAQRRFNVVEKALSRRLLDDLLSSYARSARAEAERLRRERMRLRNRNKAKRAARAAARRSRLKPIKIE
jgi:hypothetical protein